MANFNYQKLKKWHKIGFIILSVLLVFCFLIFKFQIISIKTSLPLVFFAISFWLFFNGYFGVRYKIMGPFRNFKKVKNKKELAYCYGWFYLFFSLCSIIFGLWASIKIWLMKI